MSIHPTALIAPTARLGAGVSIGPYTTIGDQVTLGDGTTVGPHAVIEGPAEVGRNCRIFSHAVLGSPPQDLKYRGEKSLLIVGDGTVIREFATLNRATGGGGGKTVVDRGCLIMAYAHVAHDCHLGDGVILANAATLGGHVLIEEHAIVGGLTGVHQFCRIGAHAIIGGCSGIILDVPPYMKAQGSPARLFGLNTVGLKRRNFPPETIRRLKQAYRLLFRSGLTTTQALERIATEVPACAEIQHLVHFIKTSDRGITR
ncbi:MAG: acyl-ACP--UDP-N-acetylglucosamine O-acyltransferase [candidate division NC10 bacterium]|nr:acyl-ACP--UDP-N-acetylglucosamine O-acyltransferase [candidate division NC10 bacterium]MBI3079919.1 acyl-ACP--UDP-N-acetylglucosamine O-acyltransferase [candidate division NC10 bacterium]MBI4413515.1 acyl-ACP--UDP-N-acetylglucosamine O-acyltransferase [candidate division NC10 bacterium]